MRGGLGRCWACAEPLDGGDPYIGHPVRVSVAITRDDVPGIIVVSVHAGCGSQASFMATRSIMQRWFWDSALRACGFTPVTNGTGEVLSHDGRTYR